MSNFLSQFSALFGSAVAAACCLGVPVVLSAMGALGLGFIIQDAYLMPLFTGFVAFTLWSLYRSSRSKHYMPPFWLGSVAGVVSVISLWLTVTGIYPLTVVITLSLVLLVAGSVWNLIRPSSLASCELAAETKPGLPSRQRRAVNGAALAIASAGVFYGLYKSVEVMSPSARAGDIKCWGGNSCKGTSACNSALNACTGQNACKGKGWNFMPEKACYTNGGVPFEGSPGDSNGV